MEKKFINILKPVLFCLVLLSILSCKNFFKGDEIADQINAAIDYANSSSHLIKVSYQEGTGNVIKPASGETYQKQSDTFEIKFEASTEYQFICWKVSSSKLPDGQDINDYIQIQDPSKTESSVKFKKELDDIVFTPVVIERPKALSCTPFSTGTLSLRDSKIQVIFNRNMDPSSIYYSADEIIALKKEKHLQNSDFLPEDVSIPPSGMSKAYGYKTINDKNEEEYIYKNILITDNEEQININKCFLAPYFKNPTTLLIPADKNNLPPEFSQIAVVLDKSFCYKTKLDEKDVEVTMGQKKDWIYLVNDGVDSKYPTISNCKIKYYDWSVAEPDPDGIELPSSTSSSVPDIDNITYIDEMYLNINLTAADDGSGLETFFELEFTKLQDEYYRNIDKPSEHIKTIKVNYKKQNDTSSSYNADVDISSLEDGVYSLKIKVSDRTNNTTTFPAANSNTYYYILVDNGIYLQESDISITDDPGSAYGLTFSWPDIPDLETMVINYKTNPEDFHTKLTEIQNPASTTSTTIQSFAPATDYYFYIQFTDKQGNNQYLSPASYTRPIKPVYKSHSLNIVKRGRESYFYLSITFDKADKQTAAQLLFAKTYPPSDNSQITSLKNFNLSANGETTVSNIDVTSNLIQYPYIIIQSKYRQKYNTPLVYLMVLNPQTANLSFVPISP